MKLQEAYDILQTMVGETIEIDENKANKGKFGHALEKFLELNLSSHPKDFEDGELKSCASKNNKLKRKDEIRS